MSSTQKQHLPEVHGYRVGDRPQDVLADLLNNMYAIREELADKGNPVPDEIPFIRPFVIQGAGAAFPVAPASEIDITVNGDSTGPHTLALPTSTDWPTCASDLQTAIQALAGDYSDVYVDYNSRYPGRVTVVLDQVAQRRGYVLDMPIIDFTVTGGANDWVNPMLITNMTAGVPGGGSTCEDAAPSTKYVRLFNANMTALRTAMDTCITNLLAALQACQKPADAYNV